MMTDCSPWTKEQRRAYMTKHGYASFTERPTDHDIEIMFNGIEFSLVHAWDLDPGFCGSLKECMDYAMDAAYASIAESVDADDIEAVWSDTPLGNIDHRCEFLTFAHALNIDSPDSSIEPTVRLVVFLDEGETLYDESGTIWQHFDRLPDFFSFDTSWESLPWSVQCEVAPSRERQALEFLCKANGYSCIASYYVA